MDDSQLNFNFKNREALLGVVAGALCPCEFFKGKSGESSWQLPLGDQGATELPGPSHLVIYAAPPPSLRTPTPPPLPTYLLSPQLPFCPPQAPVLCSPLAFPPPSMVPATTPAWSPLSPCLADSHPAFQTLFRWPVP